MPITRTVYGNTDDGYVRGPIATIWGLAKGTATTNGGLFSNTATYFNGIGVWVSSGRGGTQYYVYRAFLSFDIPETGTAIIGATLWVMTSSSGSSSSLPRAYGVEDGFNGGVDELADYNKVFSSGTTITGQYSSSTNAPAGDWTYMPLNSTAIAKMNTMQAAGKSFDLALSTAADLQSIFAPGSSSKFPMWFASYTGTSRDPYLVVQYEDNSVFFGTNF